MKAFINEIPKRNQVQLDRAKGIYNNGLDNAYPQRVERLINSSVTAKASSDMLKKFIIGDGFANESLNDIIVSSDILGDTTLFKLHSKISNTISRQNAAAMAIQYDGNFDISSVRHIPYRDCRFGLTDSKGYSGFIHYYNNWQKDPSMTWKQLAIQKVNVFNPRPDVVETQWANAKKGYKGQIAILRLDDEYIYPLSPIDSALEDADTEAQIKLFKNGELSKGFFAKYILFHTTFENDQEQRDFKAVLRKFEGGGHESSILMADAQFDEAGNMLDSANFKLQKIEQNINDKIFESYEKSVANNIRKACYAIPSILIEQQDGSFFGQSGEAFVQAVNFYNTQTADIRAAVSQWYKEIFKYSSNPVLKNANFTIKKLSYGTMDAGGTANDTPAGQ
ncbi:MAG: hypothetical protein PHG64_15510 [Paludibacter sp.]|nr:hypothetical protein [Paludibacter sp.]